ncbi:cytochrome P450 4C1-like [Haemaphysalis longicornis]
MLSFASSAQGFSLWLWPLCRVLAVFCVVFAIGKFLLWVWYQWRLLKAIEDIPGPGGRWPELFAIRFFLHCSSTNPRRSGSSVEFFQWIRGLSKIHQAAGIFKVHAGFEPMVFLCTAETAEPLLSSTSNLKKSTIYDKLHPWLGSGGLITSFGERWRLHRKLLTPAFHFRVLDNFLPVINEQGDRLVEELSHLADGKAVNLWPVLSKCTMAAICETAMGLKLHSAEKTSEVSAYAKDLEVAIKLFMKRVLQSWMWLDFVYAVTARGTKFAKVTRRMHRFTTKVVVERQQADTARRGPAHTEEGERDSSGLGDPVAEGMTEPETTENKRPAFLDLLSDYCRQGIFTVEDVRQEVDTFMFAGQDTSAQTLTWTLFALAIHPDIQRNVHEELDKVFKPDSGNSVTKRDVANLPYLDRVLKETMRVFSIVPWVGRSLTEPLKVGKYTIPEGCTCYVFMYGIHRDPAHYRDPEVFDPDRFLRGEGSHSHPFAYVPFSAGPRNCIGQKFAMLEVKVLLAKVLRRFSVSTCDHRDDLLFDSDILLRTRKPINIRLHPRKPAVVQ